MTVSSEAATSTHSASLRRVAVSSSTVSREEPISTRKAGSPRRARRPRKAQNAKIFHLLVHLPGLFKNALGRQRCTGWQGREGDVFLLENVVVGVGFGPLAALEGLQAVAGDEGQGVPVLLFAQAQVGVGHGHPLHNGRNHQRPQQHQQQLGQGIEQGQLGFEAHL